MTGQKFMVEFKPLSTDTISMHAMLFLVSTDIDKVILGDVTLVFRAHVHKYFYFHAKNSKVWISVTEDKLGKYFSPKDIFTLKLMG